MLAHRGPKMRNQLAKFDIRLINAAFDSLHLMPNCPFAVLTQRIVKNSNLELQACKGLRQ